MNARMIKRLALVGLAVCLLCACTCIGESYSASTMRLLRYDGDVVIEDASGSSRFVLANVRFSSGEAMRTGTGASASVALDDTKIVTLDENSRVEFMLEGSRMELTLTEGTLFLDVSEKLDENESLDIRTSTMSVGIRGTIVFLSVEPASDENGGIERTVFGVLEGSARIESAHDKKSLDVSAGQIATVTDVAPAEIVDMSAEDLGHFVQQQIYGDPALLERVEEAAPQLLVPNDYPADGDWEYTGKVTIIAQSASKLYDGTPLTRTGDVLVFGLPSVFGVSANAGGSLTDAGMAENPIAQYAIYNSRGENVTSHFRDIETVSGRLVVDPAPMTIWTGSAKKAYDGTPLTCEEAGFDLISASREEELWSDTSFVLSEQYGETLYGLSGTTLVHGTNPLTGETSETLLSAGQRLTVHLSDTSEAQSITFEIESVAENELPEQVLRLYADNPDLMAKACEDAGWSEETLSALISALPSSEAEMTVKDGLAVSADAAGSLMRRVTNARINVDSDITDYSGRALSSKEARFSDIRIDDSVKVTATGSQTEVGTSENTYEIDWGSENRNNFIVSEDLGTLEVVAPISGVSVTAGSASKVYDGTPLKADYIIVTGLPNGYTYEGAATGSLTDAGEASTRVASYKIYNELGEDVTQYVVSPRIMTGDLKVEPAPLSVTTGSASKVYDGTPVTSGEASLSGFVAGESATVEATGSLTDAGSADNTYAISWDSAKESNYTLIENLGTLTVSKNDAPITITSGSSSAMYTPFGLIDHSFTVEGAFPDGFSVEADITGEQLLPGTSENTISSYAILNQSGEDKTANFTGITAVNGTLSVTKKDITVWSNNETYVYRGASYAPNVRFTGIYASDSPSPSDVEIADREWVKDVGEHQPGFTATLVREDLMDKYEIGEIRFGTITITPAPLTIVTESASKGYDGKPLTAGGSLEGLVGTDSWASYTLTVTGSQTDIGSSTNGYTISWNEINPENYTVTEDIGTLTVTPNSDPIVITAPSQTFVYNGYGIGLMGGASVTGLPEGVSIVMTPTHPEIKDAGSYTTGVSYYIMGDEGDVTGNFTNITVEPGTVTVQPLKLTVDLGGRSVNYNGEVLHFGPVNVTYSNGDYAGSDVSLISASAVVGRYEGSFSLFTGDTFQLTVNGSGTEPGTYTITGSVSFTSGNPSNYSVVYTNNQLVITPSPSTT